MRLRLLPLVLLALPLIEVGLPPGVLSHYRYDGSLTTPPCTEGVRWFVMRPQKSVSPEQVSAFLRVFGENARHTQPSNARPILE